MKPILLQTTPHAGTHTCMYLFNLLGGIPTYYHHYSDWKSMDDFLTCIKDIRDRFVVVNTFRPQEALLESYRRRDPARGPALLAANQDLAAGWHAEFREAIMLPLVDDTRLQTAVAEQIFRACGHETFPRTTKLFLETWPPKGMFPTHDAPFRGFDSADELQAMNRLMEEFRILPTNDWRDKVNSSLKALSH